MTQQTAPGALPSSAPVINAGFDGGNIHVFSGEGTGDEWRFDLEIVRDHDSDFYQWFFFRVAGARGRRIVFRIVNAGGSAYPAGWPGYSTRASTDLVTWRQIDTRYDDGILSFDWQGDGDIVWFAYFAPYTMEMHARLIASAALKPGVAHRQIGTTLDGQAIDYLRIGSGAKQVWLYARQHPGESMAEWWMDGALAWLTGEAAAPLLAAATVHVVPNMNPDGTRRGHLRTNAAGVNLNREWHAPSVERSPEVLAVLRRMDETGVDVALDVHGDEAIAANFIAGFEGIPSFTDAHGERFLAFGRRLAALAQSSQVIVVTHLAQVAAFANNHLSVVKSSDGSVTASSVRALDGEDREAEMARLLSGLTDSPAALEHARELLTLGRSSLIG